MELGTIVSELLKGKKASMNLTAYASGVKALYKRSAFIKLALNYYTFSEMYYELPKDIKSICQSEVKALQELINSSIIENDAEYLEEKITSLRDSLITKMDAITAYIDELGLYEHILNRVEFKFKDCEFDNDYYRNQFETDIYNYVINDRDNSAINMKISLIMGELPMRLSRNKFYDVLKDSFSIYKGSEVAAVEDFVYRIKTAGGIYSTDGMDKRFSKVRKLIDELKAVDYSAVTEKEYELYRGKLDTATTLLMDYSDVYMIMTEVINEVYSIVLCDRALCDASENIKLKEIITYSYNVIEEGNEPDIAWAEKFVEFEGLQEQLSYKLDGPENALAEICNINSKAIADNGLDWEFNRLDMLMKLQSSSTFVTFSENEELKKEASEEYINNVVDKLCDEFAEIFKTANRTYMRAVMSGVISNLPAYFNNLKEFREYVSVALNQCSDEAEQKACMTVINMIMASE